MKMEDWVKANREAFDTREPSPRVWKKIERALGAPAIQPVVLWRAAAMVLFGVAAFLLGMQWPRQQPLAQVREFSELAQFYAAEIEKKATLIGLFDVTADAHPFAHELQKLEAMYWVLEEEMNRNPSVAVKDALILNMLVRIDLLNQQLERLEHLRADSARRAAAVGT
jgi:hypothetical protein